VEPAARCFDAGAQPAGRSPLAPVSLFGSLARVGRSGLLDMPSATSCPSEARKNGRSVVHRDHGVPLEQVQFLERPHDSGHVSREKRIAARSVADRVHLQVIIEHHAPPSRIVQVLASPGPARQEHVTSAVDLGAFGKDGSTRIVAPQLQYTDELTGPRPFVASHPGYPAIAARL